MSSPKTNTKGLKKFLASVVRLRSTRRNEESVSAIVLAFARFAPFWSSKLSWKTNRDTGNRYRVGAGTSELQNAIDKTTGCNFCGAQTVELLTLSDGRMICESCFEKHPELALRELEASTLTEKLEALVPDTQEPEFVDSRDSEFVRKRDSNER